MTNTTTTTFDITMGLATTYLIAEPFLPKTLLPDTLRQALSFAIVKPATSGSTISQGQGKDWNNFFQVYDRQATKHLFPLAYKSIMIPTSFGQTHIFLGGNMNAPASLFFHGVRATSLMWNKLAQNDGLLARRKVILIDYITDTGRSLPTRKGPQDGVEHGKWVKEILEYLEIQDPVDMIGYSYGSFVVAMITNSAPQLVTGKRVIMISPAAVFAPLRASFYYHAVMPYIMQDRFGFTSDWSNQWMSGPEIDYNNSEVNQDDIEFENVRRKVKLTYDVPLPPQMFSNEELIQLTMSASRTMLILGEHDPVTDRKMAVRRGEEAGVEVVVVKKAGHLWYRTISSEFCVRIVDAVLGSSEKRSSRSRL